MQIEITMSYHLTPVGMVVKKEARNTSVGNDVEKREPSCTVGGNVEDAATMKTVRSSSKN